MARIYNFNPGPATLPTSVLQKAQQEFLDYNSTGMSVTEISHRSKDFKSLLSQTKQNIRELLSLNEDYEVVFLGGGASLQFAMVAMNFLAEDKSSDYISTGSWSEKAIKEAKHYGNVKVIASSQEENFSYIPNNITFSENAAYVHLTSNNTIFGTQWQEYPNTSSPLVVDMSSDILCRPVDAKKFAMIYAGAQKNLGIAGVTMVVIRKDFLAKQVNRAIPTMLSYKTHVEKDSSYNTPPVFPIYMLNLSLEWIKSQGGVEAIAKSNQQKSQLLYQAIDESDGFYQGTVRKDSRSMMNVTFRLSDASQEEKFIQDASDSQFGGLKGHRSVGGIRASIYNAMPLEGVEKFVDFMVQFAKNNR
jgi:phosphoserine aminotransferase